MKLDVPPLRFLFLMVFVQKIVLTIKRMGNVLSSFYPSPTMGPNLPFSFHFFAFLPPLPLWECYSQSHFLALYIFLAEKLTSFYMLFLLEVTPLSRRNSLASPISQPSPLEPRLPFSLFWTLRPALVRCLVETSVLSSTSLVRLRLSV